MAVFWQMILLHHFYILVELDVKLPGLSMGMSNDWREAVGCGSTLIRVGSSIFHKE